MADQTEKKLEVEPNDDEEIKSGKINISIEELNILIETIGLSTLSKDKLNDLQLSLDKLKNKKYIKSGKIFINEEDKRDILIVFGNEKVFINKDGYPEININLTKPTNFILHFNIGVASKVIDSEEEKLKKVQEKIFNDKDKIEKIFLFGYACDIGSYDVNTRLSKKRAENVMELFKTSKIDMLAIPKGEVSLDITDSPEDIEMIRSGNRRTEIIVIYKDI